MSYSFLKRLLLRNFDRNKLGWDALIWLDIDASKLGENPYPNTTNEQEAAHG